MSLTRRDFLRRGAGAAIAATSVPTLLAACTGAANTTNPVPTAASGSGGSTSTALLRVGWSSEPDTMNPLTSYSTEADQVLQLVYDKLLEYDAQLNTQPGLATKQETSDGGTSVTYLLRSGVSWHDGQPFTADDVAFTFTLIATEGLSQYAQWLVDMIDAKAVAPDKVVVRFKKPQAFDPGLAIPILPQHIWKGKSSAEIQKDANEPPIGTGPFTFSSWKRGESVQVARNDNFWGPSPAASSVIWILYQNEDVMAQGLRGGDVDILTEVPPTIWDGLQGGADLHLVSLPGFSFHHIGFNVSSSPKSGGNPLLLDRTVRQAMSLALDRNQLVQLALAGHGKPGSVLLPPAIGDWQLQIPADQQLNANPDKAKQLLDQAGYIDRNGDGVRESPDGKDLSFRLIAIESTTVDVRAAQLFRDATQAVGVKLTLNTLDENTLGSTVYNADAPDWDIFVWGWDSGVNDPDYLLGVPLTSQIGGNNDVYYSNPVYDHLYDQQASELDQTKRLALVHRMQQLYYEDAPYIVMWYQDKLQAYRTDTWSGWADTPGGIIFNFTRANYLNATPV
ncbi:MAG: ABC transporter substrate-binding protein [Actinomycetota bacterium]